MSEELILWIVLLGVMFAALATGASRIEQVIWAPVVEI